MVLRGGVAVSGDLHQPDDTKAVDRVMLEEEPKKHFNTISISHSSSRYTHYFYFQLFPRPVMVMVTAAHTEKHGRPLPSGLSLLRSAPS